MRSVLAILVLLTVAGTGAAHAQGSDAVLDRIKQKKQISIGYREASIPFSFLDDDRKPVGYAFDICMKIVDAVKQKLDMPDLGVNLVPVNLQNRIALVANGTLDVECGSTTNTIARQSQIDFSSTYFIVGTRLLVKAGTGIKELSDLDGKVVGLPINSTPERLVKRLIEEKKLNIKTVTVRDNSEGFLALSTGRVDAYANDDILLFGLRKSAPNPADYEVVGTPLSFETYALTVQKNSTFFLSLVNATIARLIRTGEMQALYDKWFAPFSLKISPDLAAAFKLQATPE